MITGALLCCATALPALAALGGSVDSVEADRVHMKGQVRVDAAPGYSIHQIQIPSGTIIKEYVAPNGTVFALSWRGPTVPDLRQTLGSYFPQYEAAGATPHMSHRQLRIDEPGLVIHSSGRMRAFFGIAYVPNLLPPNFSIDDIR
jgi:hypothetical protein